MSQLSCGHTASNFNTLMKTITRILAVAALAPACYASVPVGDNAEIFLTGTVGVRSDSNIYMSPSDTEDTILDFNPGVQLVFGNTSVMKGSFSLTESFSVYSDHDDLNDELLSTSANTSYDDGKTKLNFNASFAEVNQNSVDTRPSGGDFLIRRDVFNIGTMGEVSVTEKSSVAAGIQYSQSRFDLAGFSDSEAIAIPLNYFYELTPKVDLSLGYRYRDRAESIGFDTEDHFLSVGARGEFTPKLTGQFAVGVTQRSFSHKVLRRGDDELLGVDSSLTYAASPKTSLLLGVSNDFDTNSQGSQQRNFAIRGTSTTAISSELSVTVSLAYRAIDYYQATPARIDDYFEGHLGATYTVNEHVSLTGAYSYRSNDSDLPTSNFTGNVLSLAANLRF